MDSFCWITETRNRLKTTNTLDGICDSNWTTCG